MRTDPFTDDSGTRIESHAYHHSVLPQGVQCPVYVLPCITARSLPQAIWVWPLATLHSEPGPPQQLHAISNFCCIL